MFSLRIFRLLVAVYVTISLHDGTSVYGWENAEFEMFDLVEEVGKNFYEVLGIPQDAGPKEIKQAYRKLSVKLHPDKNDAPDADVQFRQMVGVYEVLKDADLRKSYDQVLVDGLPNWRNPVFYYRRVRKLAIWQVTIIVLVIVSVGQYLAGWASYFEKKMTVQEIVDTKLRRALRTRKAQKEGPNADEVAAEVEKYLQKPSLWNIAPVQICRFTKYMVVTFPFELMEHYKLVQEEKERVEKEQAEAEAEAEQEAILAKEPKKPRKRKTVHIPEKIDDGEAEGPVSWVADVKSSEDIKKVIIKGGLWTDDDISELTKLCQRFPGGTPERWEKIAEQLCRPVQEVTFMAKKLLERLAARPAEEEQVQQIKVKVKTKGTKLDADPDAAANWTAEEQKALENAMHMYPKGALDRWDRIASMVPDRTKEECTYRFKYLADLVKKKKEKVDEEKSADNESPDTVVSEDVIQENPEKENMPAVQPSTSQEVGKETVPKVGAKSRGKSKNVTIKDNVERQHSTSSSNSNSDSDWCVIDNPRPP